MKLPLLRGLPAMNLEFLMDKKRHPQCENRIRIARNDVTCGKFKRCDTNKPRSYEKWKCIVELNNDTVQ
ncbi:hypothetical protein HZH66_010350 [Vespula vulgaris]|uniref:Uncharacterized protein n=1 Tax=Vespula vulgaris TaxID=7454 RepID=A0A834JIS8_VESVU|nr:hypothetical protein HZH66_010350 [Vespula vulgaris]